MALSAVPEARVRAVNDAPVDPAKAAVLYWMIAHRRTSWNFGLDRAVEWARELRRPLVILEELRCGNRWDSDRFHRFALDGMCENARRCERAGVLYYPYVEPRPGEADRLVTALARKACVVVTDDFPTFVWPAIVAGLARRAPVKVEAVDSNGLLPLGATERVFPSAYTFRRFLQRDLHRHLASMPRARPLARLALPTLKDLPRDVARRWPAASADLLGGAPKALADLPIDHSVPPAPIRGGPKAASAARRRFLTERLPRYAEDRNQPEEAVTSELSPYLHFGHISVHQIFTELARREGWRVDQVPTSGAGRRRNWWGMSENAEAFLDQLVTWRELGYNLSGHREDYDAYESLPSWARATLAKHAGDRRPYVYGQADLDAGRTHDPLWNAAQMQLVREGRLHNYLRMLWGKKILEWSPSAEAALERMIHLNNRYALDGRNPNSYSGILWVLGRYDRPWGPERPIFGTVRYMSSANTARKVRVRKYIARYAPEGPVAP